MRFLMFIKHSESIRPSDVPAGLMQAMGPFIETHMKSGQLLDTGGLGGTATAKRVRQEGGRLTVIDGPFTEAKEIIGGYAMMEAKDHAEALALAMAFMQLHLDHWPAFVGECEVRAVEQG